MVLDRNKDFPRNRRLSECTDETAVVETQWAPSDDEKHATRDLWPRARADEHVTVRRGYGPSLSIAIAADALEMDVKQSARDVKNAAAAGRAVLEGISDEAEKTSAGEALKAFEADARPKDGTDTQSWAGAYASAEEALRTGLIGSAKPVLDAMEDSLETLDEVATRISGDAGARHKAEVWVKERLPIFVYLDDYPEIRGHQNIAEFLDRKAKNGQADADLNFAKMCAVAGLDPEELHALVNTDTETRNQLANRAGAVITQELQSLWTDRKLKVRFNPDGNHLQTFVTDQTQTYDVDVNLDERSRGFRWFFGFYTVLAADTNDGDKDTAILLLDEPGLFLHARSQADLLSLFENDFKNQILYTTHSPFMIDTARLDRVRTVDISEDAGTTVSEMLSGDDQTLFALRAALGYDMAQSLFVGSNNLVVEGITDVWILKSVSAHLESVGRIGLHQDLVVTPAGGAQRIPYFVSLLSSGARNVLVLLDAEKVALKTRDELLLTHGLQQNAVLSVADGFDEDARPNEADVEDLLSGKLYENLVRESHATVLEGVSLAMNDKIPRVAKRFEAAFQASGVKFTKAGPARLLMTKLGNDATTLDGPTLDRFEQLFRFINKAFQGPRE